MQFEIKNIIESLMCHKNKLNSMRMELNKQQEFIERNYHDYQQEYKQLLNEFACLKNNKVILTKNIDQLRNSVDQLKSEFQSIKNKRKASQKQLKRKTIQNLEQIDITDCDRQTFNKKQSKLAIFKSTIELYLDDNPPKNSIRGLTADVENCEIELLEINKNGNATKSINELVSLSSPYNHQWRSLFNE